MKTRALLYFCVLGLAGCTSVAPMPPEFIYRPIVAGDYNIATWQRMTDTKSPVHIYIEGDGHAFDTAGRATGDPTPRGRLVRDMAARDMNANVIYMARPCQYIMTDNCARTDWTTGRFSPAVINSMSRAIETVSENRPIILIGYSGGAMVSRLILEKNPDIGAIKWVTVAGVLNHTDWTQYFNDSPLIHSVNGDEMPQLPQRHYIAEHDDVVPRALSELWTNGAVTVISGATHTDFGNWSPEF